MRRSECQRVELVRRGRGSIFDVAKLAFANHIHGFDAGNDDASTAKGFESKQGPRDAFNRAMVLLDDIVQVL